MALSFSAEVLLIIDQFAHVNRFYYVVKEQFSGIIRAYASTAGYDGQGLDPFPVVLNILQIFTFKVNPSRKRSLFSDSKVVPHFIDLINNLIADITALPLCTNTE